MVHASVHAGEAHRCWHDDHRGPRQGSPDQPCGARRHHDGHQQVDHHGGRGVARREARRRGLGAELVDVGPRTTDDVVGGEEHQQLQHQTHDECRDGLPPSTDGEDHRHHEGDRDGADRVRREREQARQAIEARGPVVSEPARRVDVAAADRAGLQQVGDEEPEPDHQRRRPRRSRSPPRGERSERWVTMAASPLAGPITRPIGHALQRTWDGCGRFDRPDWRCSRARPVPSGILTWRMPATDRPWLYRRTAPERGGSGPAEGVSDRSHGGRRGPCSWSPPWSPPPSSPAP